MRKLLAVDGNSIINRAFYGVRPLSNREGLPTNALFGMVSILEKHVDLVKPQLCAIAFDVKAPTFRHEFFAEYKAGRRPMPEDLCAQMPLAKELAEALGFHRLELAGFEADDILGTLAAMAEESEDIEAYLLTGDRDALQLISDRVHVLLITNTETVDYTPARFFEKYGVAVSQFVDVKALMGDSSDNIPGVAGIGEKTALRLIADHGSLDGVYEALPTAKFTPSVRTKLENGRESAYLSQRLAKICKAVPLGQTATDLSYTGIKRADALRLFTKFEFNAFIKRFALTVPNEQEIREAEQTDMATLTSAADITAAQVVLQADGDTVYLFDGERYFKCSDQAILEALLKCKDVQFICHDAKTQYHALEAMGVHWRGCYFDTMLGAYVLNPAEDGFDPAKLLNAYLGEALPPMPQSLAMLLRLYRELEQRIKELGLWQLMFGIEMPLCTVLTDMERCGVRVDREGLISYGRALTAMAEELAERIYYHAGGEFNIQSPKQLGEVLFERLQLPHGKKTKTGYSTNAEVLEQLRPYHPIIEDVLDYRQVTKLNSTYAEGLLKEIAADGRIHTRFKQTGTATGRLSSAEPNLQNIPIRTEMGKELRRYFICENDKYCLIDADYSQIELRLLAAIAGDEAMITAFRTGEDIHASTAARVFGVPREAVTPELRKQAKAVNFGILYGMGAHSLSQDLGITQKAAKAYIEGYMSAYPAISAYLENIVEQARADGFVTTLFGRRRYIPELKMQNKNMQHFGERVAMNSPIQGTAADIIKLAMINVHKRLAESGLDAKLILQVHDELIVECRKEDAAAAREILVNEMENAAELTVALCVGVAEGENWYESH